MRIINFLSKLDASENDMHFVIGYNCYKDGVYYTEWYENKEAVLAQSTELLRRDIKLFWVNCKVNTICIELRG